MNRRRENRGRSNGQSRPVGLRGGLLRGGFFGNELAAAMSLACLAMQLVLVVLMPGDSIAVERGDSLLIVWPSLLAAVFACSLMPSLLGQTHITVRHALLCWGLFVGWIWISVVANAGQADLRAAINEAWYWTAVVCSFFAAQFCFRTVQQRRAMAAIFIALVAMVVLHAAYQYWITMPRDAARLINDPEATMQSIGIDSQADPVTAKMFSDRLLSREPIATFALTNSLAGLLLAAVTLFFAILCDVGQVYRQTRMRWLLGIIVVAAAVMLFLTKSRTALLLLPFGLLWSAWPMRGSWGGPWLQRNGKWMLLGGVALIVVCGTVALVQFDELVVKQTEQSLGVRIDYWNASLQMITARPLFGFGPGNFQSAYYGFRLGTAHEIVADPHNFILELGATAGIPAVVLFLAAVLLTLKALFRYRLDGDLRSEPKTVAGELANVSGRRHRAADEHPPNVFTAMGVRPVVVGAVLGLPAAWLGGLLFGAPPDPEPYFVGIPVGVAVFVLLGDWIRSGWLSRFGTMGAFLILLLHLSASGGITVPGMFMPILLLLACRLPHAVNPAIEMLVTATEPTRGRLFYRSLVVLPLLLCVLFALLTWRRVQATRQGLQWAETLRAEGQIDAAASRAAAAMRSDPFDPTAAIRAGRTAFEATVGFGRPWTAAEERFWEEAIARDGRNPMNYQQAGDAHLQLYKSTQRGSHLQLARDYYQAALDRFPSAIRLRVQLAVVQAALGEREVAQRLAVEARERIEGMPYFSDSSESAALIALPGLGLEDDATQPLGVREAAANLAEGPRVDAIGTE